jgi:hypothetical protein
MKEIRKLIKRFMMSINLKTHQYKANTIYFCAFFFLISVINIGGMGAWLESENILAMSYRFGGLKTLRGFDETSLLASAWNWKNRMIYLETRFLPLTFL